MCFKSAELSNIIDNTDVMGFALEQFGKEEGVPNSVKFYYSVQIYAYTIKLLALIGLFLNKESKPKFL